MRRSLRATLALAAIACGLAPAPATAACDDGWLDIEAVRSDQRVRLAAVNRTDFPLTFSLRVRARGITLEGPRFVTATVEPQARLDVVDLLGRGRYRYYCDWTVGRLDADHDDDYIYQLPYASGRSYRVLQSYRSSFSHKGREAFAIDFRMREGTPVHAAREGIVARVEERHNIGCWRDGCGRYANYIVVLHDDGTTGEYYHLQQHGALVAVGERVRAGQHIAYSGNTGHTAMPHLHFAVYRAIDWGMTQSIAVRFLSTDGVISRPRRGGRYVAASTRELARFRTANRRSD